MDEIQDEKEAEDSELSFFTAATRFDEGDGDLSEESEGLLRFDESYSLISGISDSDSEDSEHNDDNESSTAVQEVLSDEFYDVLMGTMQECLDADCDKSQDGKVDILSAVEKKVNETVEKVAEATEEVADFLALKLKDSETKWKALTEAEWEEFPDEDAVFDYIALAIKESLSSSSDEKEKKPMTEDEILIQN